MKRKIVVFSKKGTIVEQEIMVHETLPVGILLATAGGFLDAYTYLFHGQVFASMQSGNVILLGINLAKANFSMVLNYLFPIILFLFGIGMTNGLKHYFSNHSILAWQNIAVFIEAVGIFILGSFSDNLPSVLFNGGLSFFAAIQFATYRKLAGMNYATTMTTGNLRSLADYLYQRIFRRDKSMDFKIKYTAMVIAGFFFGAFASAVFGNLFHNRAIWMVSILLIAVFVITLENQHQND